MSFLLWVPACPVPQSGFSCLLTPSLFSQNTLKLWILRVSPLPPLTTYLCPFLLGDSLERTRCTACLLISQSPRPQLVIVRPKTPTKGKLGAPHLPSAKSAVVQRGERENRSSRLDQKGHRPIVSGTTEMCPGSWGTKENIKRGRRKCWRGKVFWRHWAGAGLRGYIGGGTRQLGFTAAGVRGSGAPLFWCHLRSFGTILTEKLWEGRGLLGYTSSYLPHGGCSARNKEKGLLAVSRSITSDQLDSLRRQRDKRNYGGAAGWQSGICSAAFPR